MVKLPPVYDISHWKEVLDFNLITPKPIMMITKATEGIYLKDSKFIRFFDGMKKAGYHRGAYHFNRKFYSGVDQAKFFLNTIRSYIDDKTILILDVEEGGEKASELLDWFNYIYTYAPNNDVLLYSRRNILEAMNMTSSQKESFKKIKTWIAGYPYNPDLYESIPSFYIPDQTRFGEVVLWQYNEHGQIEGIQGDTDLNWISPEYIQTLGVSTKKHRVQIFIRKL